MDIDEDIKTTENLVLSLRQRHNALIPAANAPPEILCSIFAYHPVKVKRFTTISRPHTWLAILRVCSRWRNTYISTPTLWSDPGAVWLPEMKDYSEVVLERARGAPTDIEFYFADGLSSYRVKLPTALLEAVSWLRTLRVTGQLDTLSKIFRVLNDAPAPLLETLEFNLASDEYDKGHDLRRCRLFGGVAPALKILSLRNCMFAWDWSLLNAPTITELDIKGHSHGPRSTLEELLSVLSNLPRLEYLRLRNCLPDIMHRVAYVQDNRVELQKLAHFELVSNSPFALYAVAAHIRAPTSTNFILHCANFSLAGQHEVDTLHYEVLFEALQSHVFMDGATRQNRVPREGIVLDKHLVVRGSNEDILPCESAMEFGVMRYHEQDDLDAPFDFVRRKQTWEVFVGLTLSWEAGFEPNVAYNLRAQLVAATFGVFLNIAPLTALQAVFVAGDIFRDPAMFAVVFHKAKNVQALTLSADGALEALSGLVDVHNPLGDHLLFPSLKRLCICARPAHEVLSDGNTAFTHLRAMLRRRRDADQDAVDGLRMLDRLGLFHSEMPDAHVQRLGRLVTHGSVDLVTAEDDLDPEEVA
ncbi:hypothetical protein PENSPDRAFT_736145 [Peniophora sp. CONT]|nr:hypothetical protein PENSPDRAFT_736145 [Peniophora sp. CONT]